MTEIEFRRERQRGYQRKYIERLAEKLKSREEAQEYWEGREYFRTMGLGKVIRELEEEVMRETGDFIFE